MHAKSRVPLGVVIRSLAPDGDGEDNIDVVNFGTTGIVRCKRCRTYINPFVSWMDNGRRWRCNICGLPNDVPTSYFSHLDQDGKRRDRADRPELSSGSVEMVAPQEYMVRPPQAPVFVFVLDVSVHAVNSGLLKTAVETIKEQLDSLPGAPRTQVGFVTFDSTVHFYSLKSTLNAPQMLVVPDIEDLFLPLPDDLLVNLSDSRSVVDALLDSLPTMFQGSRSAEAALGPALLGAYRVMAHIGGLMTVFQSSLPSVGEGALKHRENPRLFGTEREHSLLTPESEWYKTKAIEFSRQQISVNIFLGSPQYTDVATIGQLAKHTGGQVYYYPAFTEETAGAKLRAELTHSLSRTLGFEAVMRVRCSHGMRITGFYGNYFIRGNDLLAVPNCNADSTIAVELAYGDAVLSGTIVSVQSALLYTTSGGERRIRVHTMAVPVSTVFADVFRHADVDAICNFIAKQALETSLRSGLEAGRRALTERVVDVIRGYRAVTAAAQPYQQQNTTQLYLPESLQLLPLYAMALQKNPAFRGGAEVRSDERSFLLQALCNMPVEVCRVFIYPRLFPVHDFSEQVGAPKEDSAGPDVVCAGREEIVLPAVMNLSAERLSSDGVYLLDDGTGMFLWVGRAAPPAFLSDVFGVASLDGVDTARLQLQYRDNDTYVRLDNIITALRQDSVWWQSVTVVREGEPAEARFFWRLVEDRASFTGGAVSYSEYLNFVNRQSLAPAPMTAAGISSS